MILSTSCMHLCDLSRPEVHKKIRHGGKRAVHNAF